MKNFEIGKITLHNKLKRKHENAKSMTNWSTELETRHKLIILKYRDHIAKTHLTKFLYIFLYICT